ncbi:restriction endonuclease subunit S [Grimontia marina]|uniref:Type-1 restriction enzyme EcoKI specificity protein n=1 Tax=Grimontia marina TaxID=646534 RepID=A0A128FC06_9GAMM|nr:restriction endonuclease subunit S [Grimontia marina]CZF83864.1 Type-1 restriction enzyme EcoKI specificity protein [Grimontia marina]
MWQVKKLIDVCEVVAGQSPEGKYYNTDRIGLPFYQGKKEYGDKYLKPPVKWTSKVTKIALDGDILMSVRAPVGPINIATEEICIGRGLAAIRAKHIDQSFLYFFLLSIQKNLIGSDGAVFNSINKKQIESIRISLPTLEVQKQIVSKLDAIFSDIKKAKQNAEKNLENTGELFESFCQNSIFSKHTKPNCTVLDAAKKEKGSMRTGPFGSQLLKKEIVDNGIAVLGIDNTVNNEFKWGGQRFITPEKFEELSKFEVKPKDVLITIMGTCGRCAIVPDDIPKTINTKHICCITLDQSKCLPEYLHIYFLHHPIARKYLLIRAKGAIMAGLNMGIIKELPLVLPSIEEQRKLIDQVAFIKNETSRLKLVYTNKIKALDELKQSVLQQAFSGKL